MLKKFLFVLFMAMLGCLAQPDTASAQSLRSLTTKLDGKFRVASAQNDVAALKDIKNNYIKLKAMKWSEKENRELDSKIKQCNEEIQRINKEKEEEEKRRKAVQEEQKRKAEEAKRAEEEAKRAEEERKAREAYEAERLRTAKIEKEANGVKFTLIRMDKGEFVMGATPEQPSPKEDEFPAHTVRFGYEYYMAETEVTQELWEAVMGNNPSETKDNHLPVTNVSWMDCQTFIEKLNKLTGEKFRLPTEEEWEYAARGGHKKSNYILSGGNDARSIAWILHNSNGSIQPVKTKQANAVGLYDMTGNVWEWCLNIYNASYPSEAIDAKVYEGIGEFRCIRGGSWKESKEAQRVAFRNYAESTAATNHIGLRLAMTIAEK